MLREISDLEALAALHVDLCHEPRCRFRTMDDQDYVRMLAAGRRGAQGTINLINSQELKDHVTDRLFGFDTFPEKINFSGSSCYPPIADWFEKQRLAHQYHGGGDA